MSWLITSSTKVPVDPFRSQVSLLLHGDGANGSTTITDSSPTPKTVTAVGNAQISTAQSKFGGASIAFDGNGDYLTVPGNSGFLFPADYTIEAWIYPVTSTFGVYATGGGGFRDQLVFDNGTCYWDFPNTGGGIGNVIATGDLNKWLHLAVCRSGTTSRLFKNGTALFTWSSTGSIGSSSNTARIGMRTDGYYMANGFIDDLRITNGICRYNTANFTPPTAPFPDI